MTVSDLDLADQQVWGETRFVARAPDGGPVAIEVIGRDANDARLFAKVWRFDLVQGLRARRSRCTRTQQLEHRAYLLLLAERAGVPVSEVVIAGVGGPDDTALLVLREPDGRRRSPTSRPSCVTDAILDDAWANLRRAARDAHRARRPARRERAASSPTERPRSSTSRTRPRRAPPERCRLDAVEFLATTRRDRRPGAARSPPHDRALGHRGLADVLPDARAGRALARRRATTCRNAKALLKGLREQGRRDHRRGARGARRAAAGVARPTSCSRRARSSASTCSSASSPASTGRRPSTTRSGAGSPIAFLLSWVPPFTGAIAMMGSVAVPLPYKAVVGEQFANNFTGLVGGTVATTALVIRFFQKQGQKVAVAASSGVLNSLAGFVVQAILVVVALVFTGDDFAPSDSGGGKDIAGFVIVLIVVGGIAHRRRARGAEAAPPA